MYKLFASCRFIPETPGDLVPSTPADVGAGDASGDRFGYPGPHLPVGGLTAVGRSLGRHLLQCLWVRKYAHTHTGRGMVTIGMVTIDDVGVLCPRFQDRLREVGVFLAEQFYGGCATPAGVDKQREA